LFIIYFDWFYYLYKKNHVSIYLNLKTILVILILIIQVSVDVKHFEPKYAMVLFQCIAVFNLVFKGSVMIFSILSAISSLHTDSFFVSCTFGAFCLASTVKAYAVIICTCWLFVIIFHYAASMFHSDILIFQCLDAILSGCPEQTSKQPS